MQKIFSQEIRFNKDDGGEHPELGKQLGEIGYLVNFLSKIDSMF